MRHHVFAQADNYTTSILIKASSFNVREMEQAYVNPLTILGVDKESLILNALPYDSNDKAPVAFIKKQLQELLPALSSIGTKYLYCGDAAYFKVLTKVPKAEPQLGYMLPCAMEGYEHMLVALGVNHKALIFNPANQEKLDLSLTTLAQALNGKEHQLGADIIHHAEYPTGYAAIEATLDKLKNHDLLSADIEAYSLDFEKAGIATISFAWSPHEGVAFPVDAQSKALVNEQRHYHHFVPNKEIRYLLCQFLKTFTGHLIWHGSGYDLKVLIYTLFMDDLHDVQGLLDGLDTVTQRFHDTKIITYLATNSTAKNKLGLKEIAHSFAGNWAKDDIKDIRKIPLPELLQYDLVDALATFWAYDKYYPRMCDDQQEALYYDLMLPSQKLLLQTELTGLPLNPDAVQEVKAELTALADESLATLRSLPAVQEATLRMQHKKMEADNAKLKVKQHPLSKYKDLLLKFRGPQVQFLLYDVMGLPVIDLSATKQPAIGIKTLEKLIHHTNDPEHIKILEHLIAYSGVAKVLSSFIPAFEKAINKGDDVVWLHGSFNLNGTVSGRLSSSGPNLQNLPARGRLGKLIKRCFQAPEGWLFCGADFSSLEDYISALTTRDPNKLKVYLEGYDGHCLRAHSYFKDDLTDIRQADESERTFKLIVNNNVVYAKGSDTLITPTETLSVEKYYEANHRIRG